MKLEIKQEDIDRGIAKNWNFCPISMAIRRTFGIDPNFASVRTEYTRIKVYGYTKDGQNYFQLEFKLPKTADRFIAEFDGHTQRRPNVKPRKFIVKGLEALKEIIK